MGQSRKINRSQYETRKRVRGEGSPLPHSHDRFQAEILVLRMPGPTTLIHSILHSQVSNIGPCHATYFFSDTPLRHVGLSCNNKVVHGQEQQRYW